MRLDLYQSETAAIAGAQTALLDEARKRLLEDRPLSRLEQNGVLHALQVLVESAIGKAKQILKAAAEPVPVSAYDCFSALLTKDSQLISDLASWNAAVGLRNRIVHDYMNIDMNQVLDLVRKDGYRFITDFLLEPIRLPNRG